MGNRLPSLDLEKDVRPWLDRIDREILTLLHTRTALVREVARIKGDRRQSLQASAREATVLDRVRRAAKALGVDVDFASEIWSLIIWHAKQTQCEELEIDDFRDGTEPSGDVLRSNLLRLTAEASADYGPYRGDPEKVRDRAWPGALGAYMEWESRHLRAAIARAVEGRALAIDLGCADGSTTRELAKDFNEVLAVDVSEEMVEVARRACRLESHVTVVLHDVFDGVPAENCSADLVVANFAAASELGDRLLEEIGRVLKPRGIAFLSFYNAEALCNYWYYPWPSTVRARLNPNDTVDVWSEKDVFTIFGRGVRRGELRRELQERGLQPIKLESYPTVQSIVPRFFFQREHFVKNFIPIAQELDDYLATEETVARGAYVLAIARKSGRLAPTEAR